MMSAAPTSQAIPCWSNRLSAILLSRLRVFLFAVIALLAATAASVGPVRAQTIVLVNGDPITQFDIDQRSKLMELSSHKAPARNDVIEDLISDKLKIGLLKKYNIEGIEKDVNNAYNNMAKRMHATPRAFTENLTKQGLKPETLRLRIRADLVWQSMIRGRYQSNFQFSDKEVDARLNAKNLPESGRIGYDYTLRPILFVVPPGSPPAAFEVRAKEAEALRGRFQDCASGLAMARGIRYVAVRPEVVKSAADLPEPLRVVLEKTELGHLTAPETTQQGIEIYALCSKRKSDNPPAKKEIRDEMANEVFQSLSKKMLKELREQAMIEYPK
jgi:peptidyl-prolyl cis-trans isomerase SurA